MSDIVLKVRDLWKEYPDITAVKGVSFDLAKGETKVLFGPSGSGKSTLVKCIAMLQIPTKGEIWLGDIEITSASTDLNKIRARIGYVFQNINLFHHLTALGNVSIGPRRVMGLSKEEAEERAMKALEDVRLETHASHYPAELSGGQKQRVGIARALVMNPELIIFDEPSSSLDPELTGEVLDVMGELSEEGRTIILVTHEMGFAMAAADEMMFLEDGQIVEQGTPQHFSENPESKRAKSFLEILKGY